MSKHLIRYSTRAVLPLEGSQAPLLEVDSWEYFKKRIQFRRWKLHRTMGRPILILRKEPS